MRHKNFYQVNENYFDEIDSHNKAYVLGFILADAHIGKYELSIKLQEGDIEILEFIKDQLEYTGIIKTNKGRLDYRTGNINKSTACLRIYNKKLLDKLRSFYNLTNHKSLDLVLPISNINKEFINSFILGFFDGDGCIYKSKIGQYQLSFCGTQIVCNQIQDILINNCGLSPRKTYFIKNCCQLRYCGIAVIERIRNFMYKDSSFSLSRKRIKLEEMKYKRNPNKLIKF